MYITKVEIENVKGIKKLALQFNQQAGWNVLIGENASGKTTIIRAISMLLIGKNGARSLFPSWKSWLREDEEIAKISISANISYDLEKLDEFYKKHNLFEYQEYFEESRKKEDGNIVFEWKMVSKLNEKTGRKIRDSYDVRFFEPETTYQGDYDDAPTQFFSAGYGSLRRLSGEEHLFLLSQDNDNVLNKIDAHISVFNEKFGLIKVVDWLKILNYKRYEKKPEGQILDYLTIFLNESKLLPQGVKLHEVSSDGVSFTTSDNHIIDIYELSDGYRTILATVLDIIHKMLYTFSQEEIFEDIKKGNPVINVEGVVLIDEIDAHLHPTWQAKIGEWFTSFFPRLQFIVTTHSPIICRAASKGSIWKLENLERKDKYENKPINQAREIIDLEKKRLVYGNILDALGTEAFGRVASSVVSEKLQEEMGALFMKSIRGLTTKKDEERLKELQNILPTEKPILVN